MDDAKLEGDIYEIVRGSRRNEERRRTLLSNVKAICSVRIIISASKELPKHRVVTADKAELTQVTTDGR